jgi:hypothetical protein
MLQIKRPRWMNQSTALMAVGACLSLTHPSSAWASQQASESMCAKNESIVFSCPLGNGKKIVSLCAASNTNQGQAPFYYAYGHLPSPELVYPPKGGEITGTFTKTHLIYGGATGGTAYSFVNGGYKYIVYSISGTGLEEGGMLLQRIGQTDAAQDIKCQRGKITESDDDKIIKAAQQWKSDPDLETHGLPSVH